MKKNYFKNTYKTNEQEPNILIVNIEREAQVS